jgi:hypothetical protein
LVFKRRRWAIRVIKRAGFLTRSREGKILVDLLVGESKRNPKDLPTPEQVLFAALRMFHNQAAIARMAGTPKVKQALGVLITNYARRRAGITLTPHQTRHLSAKVLLDDQPGGFEIVRQILGHKNLHHTVLAYAGIDSRRAGRHHQHLIEEALSAQNPSRSRGLRVNRVG